jgi:oxalate decarboxylase
MHGKIAPTVIGMTALSLLAGALVVKARAEETSNNARINELVSIAEMNQSDEMPEIKYELEKKPLTTYTGGWSHEVTAKDFPVSKGIAGVSMTLRPGGLRELHWHANAAEWAYVISGHCRVTVIDPQGRSEIKDFGPGDVWYFPRGHGHSIQGIGNEECKFILTFDNGYFSEFSTFSISDWIAQTQSQVLSKAFGLPEAVWKAFPKKEVYIAQGNPPPALAEQIPMQDQPALTHKFSLSTQEPDVSSSGVFNMVDQKKFPIATTMSGATLKIAPGAIRQLHWHPGSDEWQYYIKGHARMTVFGAKGRKTTREFGPGDVGYVPQGYGHYIEAVGNEQCEMLAVFNSGTYEEITLAEWLRKTPRYILETNFGIDPKIIDELQKVKPDYSRFSRE